MAKKQVTVLPTAADRKAAIDRIIQDAGKVHGPGRVSLIEHTNNAYNLRRPTGLLSLDIALAGGWPAAAPSVLAGPDGVGKDYMLWRTAAQLQTIYGDDFLMACYFTEFQPDKRFMKDVCGFQIAFSEEEIAEMDRIRHDKGQPGLTADELDYYRYKIGDFLAIVGVSADHGFDQVFQLIKTNFCQVVAVNSIGFMQTEAKENTESYEEFAQQRNEAMLLSKALPQFAMYMNQPDAYGRPNETSLILVNQMRSKDGAVNVRGRPVMERDTYKTAANSWALKHGKAVEVQMHQGRIIPHPEDKSIRIGREKQWEITKGKLGTHEGIKGDFKFYYDRGVDIESDLIETAVSLGVMEIAGSWVTYGKRFKTQGVEKAAEKLREEPEMSEEIRGACYAAAEVQCRLR